VKVEICECDLGIKRLSFHFHVTDCIMTHFDIFFRDELMKKSNGTYFLKVSANISSLLSIFSC
jgi:hypothetical protein